MSGSSSISCLLVLDGCIYLSIAPSLAFCLLVVLVFTRRGIKFLPHQFYSVSNISFEQINHEILNLCFLISSSDPHSFYLGLVGTSSWPFQLYPHEDVRSFIFLFLGSIRSCGDLNPYSLTLPQAVALFVPPVAGYSVSLAAETTPHLSSGHLANHCQNCFVARSPAKSLSHSGNDLLVCSSGGPKASNESLFSAALYAS